MPADVAEQPRLRVVQEDGSAIEGEVIGTSHAVMPTSSAPTQAAIQPQTDPSSTALLKQLAFEAALFGVGGATAGVLAAASKRRPKGALFGSMGSVGVYGLYRATLGGKYLPTLHRAALGLLGAALLGGSGYLAFFHKTAAPSLGRLPASTSTSKSKSKRKTGRKPNKVKE
jgi:hypothetical protein